MLKKTKAMASFFIKNTQRLTKAVKLFSEAVVSESIALHIQTDHIIMHEYAYVIGSCLMHVCLPGIIASACADDDNPALTKKRKRASSETATVLRLDAKMLSGSLSQINGRPCKFVVMDDRLALFYGSTKIELNLVNKDDDDEDDTTADLQPQSLMEKFAHKSVARLIVADNKLGELQHWLEFVFKMFKESGLQLQLLAEGKRMILSSEDVSKGSSKFTVELESTGSNAKEIVNTFPPFCVTFLLRAKRKIELFVLPCKVLLVKVDDVEAVFSALCSSDDSK